MKKFLLVLVCLTLPGIAGAQNVLSGNYSANLVTINMGHKSTSKVYVGDRKLRTEVTMGPVQVVTITRLDEKVVYILLPVQKIFVEKPLQEEDGLLAYVSDKNSKRELVGTEAIKNQPCDKYKIAMRDKVFYVWINKSTQTPMQMLSVDSKTRTEWDNVQIGPQPTDLFKPPGDFRKFTGAPEIQKQ